MDNKEKKRKLSLQERAAVLLELPMESSSGLPRVIMSGDRELRLEGYRSILFCGREEIHVDGGKWVLRVIGRELEIRAMREKDLLLVGWIDKLELV